MEPKTCDTCIYWDKLGDMFDEQGKRVFQGPCEFPDELLPKSLNNVVKEWTLGSTENCACWKQKA